MAAADVTEATSFEPHKEVSLGGVLVWGLGALFYFYEFILQTSTSIMIPDLMRAFQVSAEELGILSSYYFWCYALMQIPVGLLMDKFGPRKLLFFASILCAAGCYCFYSADTIELAKLGRSLMGFGGAFAVVGTFKLATLWFPQNRFALFAGLTVAVGFFGAGFGQGPVSLLVESIGWREAMLNLGYLGLLMAAVIWLVIRDKEHMQAARKHEKQQINLLYGLYKVTISPQTWLASVYAGLMFVPTIAFGELWGVPYLQEVYPSISRSHAGFLISIIFMGWMVGGPVFGWISDFMGRRNKPMAISCIGTIAAMCAMLYIPNLNQVVMGVFLFLLGAFSSGFVIAFSVVRENHIFILGGTAMGFVNMLNSLGGAIGQPLIGRLLDSQWTGATVDGVRVFSLEAYQNALDAIPWCLVVALLLLPFIKETYCKFKVVED